MSASFDVQGVSVPAFLYGTAWKEDDTERLVTAALDAGFRGIDTANQRKHYFESAVGDALRKAWGSDSISRDDIFLQTKFTDAGGQDDRLPYDPSADYGTQVRQSFASSCEHLGVDRVDSYLIHGPQTRGTLTAGDLETWRAMERLHSDGRVRLIGISNVTAKQLEQLCDEANVAPAFVQNRCYAELGWDRDVRRVCGKRGVRYQGFSLLTANVREIRSRTMHEIAARHERTPAQIVFRFAFQLGMICLTGTTDPGHMREDLDIFDFELSTEEVAAVESLG